MGQRPRLSAAARSAAADAVLVLLDKGGHLAIYDGEQPYSPDESLEGSMLLVTLRFSDQAFRPSAFGIAVANPLSSGTAMASGKAQFFRCWTAALTGVMDGKVGSSDSDLNLSALAIRTGATVSITSFQYRQAG